MTTLILSYVNWFYVAFYLFCHYLLLFYKHSENDFTRIYNVSEYLYHRIIHFTLFNQHLKLGFSDIWVYTFFKTNYSFFIYSYWAAGCIFLYLNVWYIREYFYMLLLLSSFLVFCHSVVSLFSTYEFELLWLSFVSPFLKYVLPNCQKYNCFI